MVDVRVALSEENDRLIDENTRLRAALDRAHTVLSNMAAENEGAIFRRWPINHEPLRNDARNLLPVIRAALDLPERDKTTPKTAPDAPNFPEQDRPNEVES